MCAGSGHGNPAWDCVLRKIGLDSRMDFQDKNVYAFWIMMSWVCARQVLYIFFELLNVSGYIQTQSGPVSLLCTSAYQAREVPMHCKTLTGTHRPGGLMYRASWQIQFCQIASIALRAAAQQYLVTAWYQHCMDG